MRATHVKPNMDKFAILILCHERPNYKATYNTLLRSGYSGKVFFIVDDMDDTKDEYIKEYGGDAVFVFNKRWKASEIDSMNNSNDLRSPLYARAASWECAKENGLDYFCVMDDDYSAFSYKQAERERISTRLDDVFFYFVEYLINSPITALAFAQGGDYIGGYDPFRTNYKRKCMNAWFLKTNEPFDYYGMLNDDVNTYIQNGIRGKIFMTIYSFMLHQSQTQLIQGGITESYLKYGTYVKSFYTVMISPSSINIALMGEKSLRLHHRINWSNTIPCIIQESFKKSL